MKKIMHQVWAQGESLLPKEFVENRKVWQEAFPDFEMILWDDVMAKEQWDDYAEHTSTCYHHATRCDLILARAIRDFGGLAFGTDSTPNNPEKLRDFITTHDTLLVYIDQYGNNVSNGLQWSAKTGHQFWKNVCEHQTRLNGRLLKEKPPNISSGPICYTECLKKYKLDDLDIVSGFDAYTNRYDPKRTWNNPKAFIDAGYAKSWVK